MKQDIHPQYFPKATVTCSCGAKHVFGATKEKMTVEICSECHPFYTGKEKLVDTAGRVEKFRARREKAEVHKTSRKTKAVKSQAKEKKSVSKPVKGGSPARDGQAASGKKTTVKKAAAKKSSAKNKK